MGDAKQDEAPICHAAASPHLKEIQCGATLGHA